MFPRMGTLDGPGGTLIRVLEEVEERLEGRAVVDGGEEEMLKLHG